MTTTKIEKGTPVRFLTTLGLITAAGDSLFVPETVVEGDTGTYEGPHPSPGLAEEDWHLIRVPEENIQIRAMAYGHDLFAPVHTSHFEVVDA